MNLNDFNPTTVPGVETFGRAEGYFYCNQYDDAGHAKIVQAAENYVTDYRDRTLILSSGREKTRRAWDVWRTAMILIEDRGAESDLYQRQSNTRWVLDASDVLRLAEKIVGAQG